MEAKLNASNDERVELAKRFKELELEKDNYEFENEKLKNEVKESAKLK